MSFLPCPVACATPVGHWALVISSRAPRVNPRSRVDSPFRPGARLLAPETLFIKTPDNQEFPSFIMLSKTSVSTRAFLVAASTVICAMWLWQSFHDIPKNHPALPWLLAVTAGALLGGLYLAKAPAPARDERSRAEDAEGISGDAVFGMTPDGYIISWNAAAERMSGYSARVRVPSGSSTRASAGTCRSC